MMVPRFELDDEDIRRLKEIAKVNIPGMDDLSRDVKTLEEHWKHSNRFHAEAACKLCGGIIRHEEFCPEINARVQYAFNCAGNPTWIKPEDELMLRGLGVRWNVNKIA